MKFCPLITSKYKSCIVYLNLHWYFDAPCWWYPRINLEWPFLWQKYDGCIRFCCRRHWSETEILVSSLKVFASRGIIALSEHKLDLIKMSFGIDILNHVDLLNHDHFCCLIHESRRFVQYTLSLQSSFVSANQSISSLVHR